MYRHWTIGINGLGYGVPTQHVFSDNGSEFTSDISDEFSKLLGIDWKYTPSHSPHSNGSCERNHWTVDRKFDKFVNDTKGKVDLQRCLARTIFLANNTSKDSGFSPSQIVQGYAPKPPCVLQIDTNDEHVKERSRHDSTPHNAREALLAIHETHVKHREVKTIAQLTLVEKNRVAECANRKYRPGAVWIF